MLRLLGPSKERKKKKKKEICAELPGEQNSLTGVDVGWSREKLRHPGTREASRLSKNTRQGRAGICTIYPQRGALPSIETLAPSSPEELRRLHFCPGLRLLRNTPSTKLCVYGKITFPDSWVFIGSYFERSL